MRHIVTLTMVYVCPSNKCHTKVISTGSKLNNVVNHHQRFSFIFGLSWRPNFFLCSLLFYCLLFLFCFDKTRFGLGLNIIFSVLATMLNVDELKLVDFKSIREEESDRWVDRILKVLILHSNFTNLIVCF